MHSVHPIHQGIKELLDHLLSETLAQTYIGEMIPEAWLALERQILRCILNSCTSSYYDQNIDESILNVVFLHHFSLRKDQSLITWDAMVDMGKAVSVFGNEVSYLSSLSG